MKTAQVALLFFVLFVVSALGNTDRIVELGNGSTPSQALGCLKCVADYSWQLIGTDKVFASDSVQDQSVWGILPAGEYKLIPVSVKEIHQQLVAKKSRKEILPAITDFAAAKRTIGSNPKSTFKPTSAGKQVPREIQKLNQQKTVRNNLNTAQLETRREKSAPTKEKDPYEELRKVIPIDPLTKQAMDVSDAITMVNEQCTIQPDAYKLVDHTKGTIQVDCPKREAVVLSNFVDPSKSLTEIREMNAAKVARVNQFLTRTLPLLVVIPLIVFAGLAKPLIMLADYASVPEKQKRYARRQFEKSGVITLGYSEMVRQKAQEELRIMEELALARRLAEAAKQREEEQKAQLVAKWNLNTYFESIGAKPSKAKTSPAPVQQPVLAPSTQDQLLTELISKIHYGHFDRGVEVIDRLNGREAKVVVRGSKNAETLREHLETCLKDRKISFISSEEAEERPSSQNIFLRVA